MIADYIAIEIFTEHWLFVRTLQHMFCKGDQLYFWHYLPLMASVWIVCLKLRQKARLKTVLSVFYTKKSKENQLLIFLIL